MGGCNRGPLNGWKTHMVIRKEICICCDWALHLVGNCSITWHKDNLRKCLWQETAGCPPIFVLPIHGVILSLGMAAHPGTTVPYPLCVELWSCDKFSPREHEKKWCEFQVCALRNRWAFSTFPIGWLDAEASEALGDGKKAIHWLEMPILNCYTTEI